MKKYIWISSETMNALAEKLGTSDKDILTEFLNDYIERLYLELINTDKKKEVTK